MSKPNTKHPNHLRQTSPAWGFLSASTHEIQVPSLQLHFFALGLTMVWEPREILVLYFVPKEPNRVVWSTRGMMLFVFYHDTWGWYIFFTGGARITRYRYLEIEHVGWTKKWSEFGVLCPVDVDILRTFCHIITLHYSILFCWNSMCLGVAIEAIHKYPNTHIISLFRVNLRVDVQFKFKMVRLVHFPKQAPYN